MDFYYAGCSLALSCFPVTAAHTHIVSAVGENTLSPHTHHKANFTRRNHPGEQTGVKANKLTLSDTMHMHDVCAMRRLQKMYTQKQRSV